MAGTTPSAAYRGRDHCEGWLVCTSVGNHEPDEHDSGPPVACNSPPCDRGIPGVKTDGVEVDAESCGGRRTSARPVACIQGKLFSDLESWARVALS